MNDKNAILSILAAGALLVLLFACFVGCATPKVVTEYKERTVEVRVRDTAITTKADSASIRALLHCDSAYNVVIDELTTLQGTRIKAGIKTQGVSNRVSNGVPNALQIDLNCKEDSLQQVIHMMDSIIKDYKSSQVVQTISVPRERSGYDRFCSTFFWVVVIILLALGAFWVCDKIPATKPYTAIIRGLFKWL